MLESGITIILIILTINIVYVSLSTIRIILTLKGKKYIAAAIGTIEIMLYTVGLGIVLDNLGQIENLIAYGLGYGLGVIVGSKIEERLALGYISVNVVSTNPDLKFTETLREKGFGVTSWNAYGMDGERIAIQVLTPRKYESNLYKMIKQIDPKAFVISYEPKNINGGFWVKKVKQGRIKRNVEQIEETIKEAEKQQSETTEQEQKAIRTDEGRND